MENTSPNTNNFLNWVEIKNFKSIKDLRLDCKRVNVFIGKPNVGKSNILEGLGLLGVFIKSDKLFDDSIRFKDLKHLFFDNDWREPVQVSIDRRVIDLQKQTSSEDGDYIYSVTTRSGGGLIAELEYTPAPLLAESYFLSASGRVMKTSSTTNSKPLPYKKYDFINLDAFTNSFEEFLSPPNGSNLFEVIDQSDDLKNEFGQLFQQQGLDFVLSRDEQLIELQRRNGFYVVKYPFFSIADTFRRFMFYITAIESNKNSVIIFEEPEVHSFPPYTQDVAYRMIYSEENQFFVSTHSPYLLQTLVSNLRDDQLNVFVTYYQNYETKVKALTAEELSFVQEYSTDVFFNLDRFIPNAQSANPA